MANDRLVWGHWVLKTSQREAMLRWYGEVFGATVAHEGGPVAFLRWDDEHHRLALVQVPRALFALRWFAKVYRKLYGTDHLAFSLPSLRALLERHERLANKGIRPVWAINHGLTTSLYYEDPDGNRIEFQTDNFDTREECQRFMEGPTFAANPIGVNFDPAYLYQRMREGVPEATLRMQGAGTPPGQKPVGGFKAITWRTL